MKFNVLVLLVALVAQISIADEAVLQGEKALEIFKDVQTSPLGKVAAGVTAKWLSKEGGYQALPAYAVEDNGQLLYQTFINPDLRIDRSQGRLEALFFVQDHKVVQVEFRAIDAEYRSLLHNNELGVKGLSEKEVPKFEVTDPIGIAVSELRPFVVRISENKRGSWGSVKSGENVFYSLHQVFFLKASEQPNDAAILKIHAKKSSDTVVQATRVSVSIGEMKQD
jgi:hypothetical protein